MNVRRHPHLDDMELYKLAHRVEAKEAFLEFVAALRADWEAARAEEGAQLSSPGEPGARGWENPDLGRFLAAMQAWTEDMGDSVTAQPSWRTLAEMLMAAKMYE